MLLFRLGRPAAVAALCIGCLLQAQTDAKKDEGKGEKKDEKVVVSGAPVASVPGVTAAPPDSTTEQSVTAGGQVIAYKAVAGTLTVGYDDTHDALLGLDGKLMTDTGEKAPDKDKPEDAPATARMFYTAYFKKDASAEQRPVMFLYNGGPGSATMWLHMGSFGPRRVVTTDTQHDVGAPYKMINNAFSLPRC